MKNILPLDPHQNESDIKIIHFRQKSITDSAEKVPFDG